MLENPSSTHPDFDETWRRIESLVDEIAHWARNADSLADFYGLLLQRSVTELSVDGGAIWHLDAARRLQRIDMIGSPAIESLTQRPAHLHEIQQLFLSGQANRGSASEPVASSLPNGPTPAVHSIPSPDGRSSCLAAVVVDGAVEAVLELVLAAGTELAVRENTEHVMAALADVAVDFHRAAELRNLRQQVAAWDSAQAFADCIHRRLDLDDTCYAIANEGRKFIGADRVSVWVAQRGSYRVRAVSGIDRVDRRSPELIILRKLAKVVALYGEPVWSEVSTDRPPQIQELLDTYHDTSGVGCVALVPIISESHDGASRPLGVLVVEQFKGDKLRAEAAVRLEICCRQTRSALANALEMHSLPLLRVSRGIRSLAWLFGFQSLGMFALAMLALLHLVAGVVAALCFVQVDFTITARGRLQPIAQQDIFAPADGVVEQALVRHGDGVDRGDPLVQLRNPELDYEMQRLQGELATTEAKLQAVQAARVMDGRDRVGHHNGEIERLKHVLVGLQQQLDILSRQRRELTVRAPLDGQIMSWEADKSLVSRPVRQGQRLMTVADVRGAWRLEVDVPDTEIGHLLKARQRREDDGLPVTYLLLTDPATTQRGVVSNVGLATDVTTGGEPTVRVLVDVESGALSSPRPGAGVVGRIDCGRRPLGYVWFRRFYEKLRMHIVF